MMMNHQHPIAIYSSLPYISPDLDLDPVLTDAISVDESGHRMEAVKQEDDEGSELFGLPSPQNNWNTCFSSSSNVGISGAISSVPPSSTDLRFLRPSNDVHDPVDLPTAFGDLNPSEEVAQSPYGFARSADRLSCHMEEYDDDNGCDSGFGSLQLTPNEMQSDNRGIGITPSLMTPVWQIAATELPTLTKDAQYTAVNRCQSPNHETVNYRGRGIVANCSPEADASDSANCFSPAKTARDCYVWGDARSLLQDYEKLEKSMTNGQITQLSLSEPYSGVSVSSGSHASGSSSSSFLYEISPSPPSPVSHRNINKRVAQQEASEFLSCSEGCNADECFDDLENFTTKTEFDNVVFNNSGPECLPSQAQPITRGFNRHFQSFRYSRGQRSPIAEPTHHKSRSTALALTSFDRLRKNCAPRNSGRKRNLLNFILELLNTRQNCVEWVDKSRQVFQIINPDQLSRLWGEHKNNIKMSFDSLSRSLRLYYKPGKLERVPGTRHQYRLIQKPPESVDLLSESAYGGSMEHRRSSSAKQQNHHVTASQNPYL